MIIANICSENFDLRLISSDLSNRCDSLQEKIELLSKSECDDQNYRRAIKIVKARLNERNEEAEARLWLLKGKHQDLDSLIYQASLAADPVTQEKLETLISERDAVNREINELNKELIQNKAIQSHIKLGHIEAKLVDLCGHFDGDERGLLDQAWKAHQRGTGTLEAYRTLEERRSSLLHKKTALQSLSNGISTADVDNALLAVIKHLALEHKTMRDTLEFVRNLEWWCNKVCPEGRNVRMVAAERIFTVYTTKANHLDLSGMGLSSLPEVIMQLGLKELNAANNQLCKLPAFFSRLPSHCVIKVQGNKLSSEAIELFQIEINRRFLFLRARGPSLELSIPEIIPPEEGIITQGLGLNADQLTGGSLKGPGLMTEAATEDLDPKIVQLTANLLKEGPCFTPEVERDQGRELRCGRTVAQMQGCSAFCKKAFSCTAGTPLVLSPQYLRNWQEQHQLINDLPYNNTYLSLKYKRIGHAFNLAGMIELPYQEYAVLEGNNETFLFPSLHAAFNQFASSRTDLISDQMRISIADSLSKAVWHENATEEKIDEIYANIHDPNFCDSMIIGGGHDWHSIQYIFRKTPSGEIFLFCCNRGEGSDLKPGIVILRVQNPQAITKDFLKGLARRLITTKEEHLSLKKIKEKLQGVETAFIAMKSGKVGNCVYLNYKTAFFALLLIENLKDHLEVSNFNFPTQKLESVQQIYKEFSRFDASAVLEDFLIDLKQPISKQFLEGENETYWKGVRQMAWLLQDRFNGYLDRVNLGEQPKVSHELLQKARKNINSFFETFPL